MEYQYSEVVDPSLYETHDLSNGIELRMHKDSFKETNGARRAQRDWAQYVRPVEGYYGGLGDPYTFIRVTIPECLPERLEIISYANEFAFLYDDAMEDLDLKNPSNRTPGLLDTFGDNVLDPTVRPKSRPEKQLQAKVFSEMRAIDSVRAVTSMKAWATFVGLAARTRSQPFRTMEEYIPSRIIDAGELIWFGTLTFAMALTIPQEEYNLCMELARPGYAALGLTNDLYSWAKERETAKRAGQDYVFNAVWVIMNERSVSEEEAKSICSEVIKKYVAEYCQVVEKTRNDRDLSRDLRAYIEAVMYSISGNLVWSIYCPRYHKFQVLQEGL
ncbi:isoprenoid synthase domain-containing protein [Biscogniauxia marginata]|nr:isoprenoid synthase domain-containing protein [Biscogniauxia marginata]